MGKGSDKKPGLISDAVKTHNWFKKNDQTNIILIFLKKLDSSWMTPVGPWMWF
jgi:hypothetical protein